ncbi:MAG: adenylosuccinate synthase [Clostridia bacterium]|nr:adenylosuccinate synthase [Clostridia bacterium]
MITALVGSQWGDEGKGKVIDIMSSKADVVVRATGGNNAGHTVVSGGKTYKLHLVPSGVLYDGTICCIGAGCVIDPLSLLKEMADVEANGTSLKNLKIDYRAHIVMPYHLVIDGLSEKAKGAGDIGTTKRGIGPCYMDKAERIGIRFYDLIHPEIFAEKLKANLDAKHRYIKGMFGEKETEEERANLTFEKIYNEYSEAGAKLAKYADDCTVIAYNADKEGKYVLFEGAQGTLLDLDMGTYPFVTSSHPVTGGFCVSGGIGPTLIKECIGICKSYTTRVGKGPFPTELFDETGDFIREAGFEYGTTTGRPRRCGWLDLVILKYAVRINGLTGIALNKLDTLTGLKELKVCVGYEKKGEIVTDFPADINELKDCVPVYETLPGWDEDITQAKKLADLPEAARNYLAYVEKYIGCPIKLIGVGPDRTQSFEA